jgi:PAS domain S-box-containing protein
VVKEQSVGSQSIRRRVVGLFLLLIVIIFLPVFFFIRSWLIASHHKFDEKWLAQSYRSFSYFFNTHRQFLEMSARVVAQEPAVLACLTGGHDFSSADMASLKERAGLDMLTVLNATGHAVGGDSNADIFETQSGARKKWLTTITDQTVSGFVFDRSNQLWLVALAPVVLRSQDRSVGGYLVMGKAADSEFFDKLNQDVDATIVVVPAHLARRGVVADPSAAVINYRIPWDELMNGQVPYVVSRTVEDEGERVRLSAVLRDIQGDVMGVALFSNWSGRFLWSTHLFVLFIWLLVFSFSFSIYFMVRMLGRYVTSPLIQLRSAIREIAASGNLSQRLPVEGGDEIGGLIAEFNTMMQTLEETNEKLKRSTSELSILYMDLLDQKKFTSEILAVATSIVLVILPDGRVKYINEAIERIAGFKTEEVVGRNWFENFLPFRIREEVRRVFDDILKADLMTARQFQNEILTKDGSERLILWSNSFFTDKEGRITSALAIGQDITEYKKVENELRQKMRDLERFYKVTMDREKIVLELKKELAALRAKNPLPPAEPKASS